MPTIAPAPHGGRRRGTRQRLEGLAISVPLAAVGFGGFVLAGFGG